MLRNTNDIIKEELQRREFEEKGVGYKGKPIDLAPKARTKEAPMDSSKGGDNREGYEY